ncbi:MAG: 30S ribosomal protein S16 [Microgenomates group bacterium GW2011_GWF2_45_18]|nr:MAG: 30S ribosomal protein S16 [Microgenomates group bacterium GW2011_GWF1_44_10]KKU01758.1 MAG: 30S ribosomal protein S16 [Microgenomates group bacterium GW2011_GWF2_45_18]OGJ41581.1 MAG: 30S ribosomal protein S16 [Candidatus Pacebacteria bacterium RIFOXYB1_FULL_44_10]HAU98938.1 30S ribosomal protein S16 [Candidatus Paceibacterota bacterium]HAX01105.1 30S ribosomal protein S16 [Candidatus Paceibacterota bacterium]
MVKLKLVRTGRKRVYTYRIVVAEAKSKINGKYIDLLGHYNPSSTPKEIVLDLVKYDAWVKKGAQPTTTVASLAKRMAIKK